MPAVFAASATLNVPTAVFAAPAPSVMVNVAVVPLTTTDDSDPAEGTLVNVHGTIPAE